jgi:NTE family protein
MKKPFKIGIALSGGGAKGVAHIGVIKALQEANIVPEVIAGTSAGSIVGALYAAGCSTEDMISFVKDGNFFKIFRVIGLPGAGVIKLTVLTDRLREFIAEDSFEALEKKLYVCTTNLNLGRAVFFDSGSLFDVVMASCAVPWIFKPVEINGHIHADGGMMNNLPSEVIRPLCDVLIGSNVKPKIIINNNQELNTFYGITTRLMDLGLWANTKAGVKICDVYIAPPKIHEYSSFLVRRVDEMVEIGYEATMQQLPKLRQVLARVGEQELQMS